jgi:hypothetical protein
LPGCRFVQRRFSTTRNFTHSEGRTGRTSPRREPAQSQFSKMQGRVGREGRNETRRRCRFRNCVRLGVFYARVFSASFSGPTNFKKFLPSSLRKKERGRGARSSLVKSLIARSIPPATRRCLGRKEIHGRAYANCVRVSFSGQKKKSGRVACRQNPATFSKPCFIAENCRARTPRVRPSVMRGASSRRWLNGVC